LHTVPRRVLAPHWGAWRKGKGSGLFLRFIGLLAVLNLAPTPRLAQWGADVADDRLAAGVNMDVFNPLEVLAASAGSLMRCRHPTIRSPGPELDPVLLTLAATS